MEPGIQDFKVPTTLNALSRTKTKVTDETLENANKTIASYLFEQEVAEREPKSIPSLPVAYPPKEPVPSANSSQNSVQQLAKYTAMLAQLKYKEPEGAAPFDSRYNFEVLKNGSIVDKIEFNTDKSFGVIGRIPACDFEFQHPTISRMHAVIQYFRTSEDKGIDEGHQNRSNVNAPGLYVYDLNSTHGTFLNKNRLIPERYYRLYVGHVLKFGSSTRLYVVVGPDDDIEDESEKTLTELMKERNAKILKRQNSAWKGGATGEQVDSDEEDLGVGWGMAEDAVEENALGINPFALDFHESNDLSLDNPKRTLHSWFEREGHDLFYDVKEKNSGHFICTINLPLDGSNGAPVIAEVDAKGKKKEIMVQCALKACQILDKYGVLRKSNQEGMKRKSKDWEEKDYYSSDEDTFLDRTGSVERKRNLRMKQAGKLKEKVETFDSMVAQYNEIQTELDGLEQKIQEVELKRKSDSGSGTADPLDAFMHDLKSGVADVQKMKSKAKDLVEDQNRLLKLINMAKPFGVTFPANQDSSPSAGKSNDLPTQASMERKTKTTIIFGPRRGLSVSAKKSLTVSKPVKPASQSQPVVINLAKDEEELKIEPMDLGIPIPVRPPTSATKECGIAVEETSIRVEKRTNPIKINSGSESDPGGTEEEMPKRKLRRNRQPKKPMSTEYDSTNPDYSVWVPPADQCGDGKTKLNEKLGY